ncbi:MAG: histidine kinase [Fibromonadales bacterium]|nr:histidine kinase [Fibromonadales bacterium]
MSKLLKSKWHAPPPLVHVLVWFCIYIIPMFFILSSGENLWKIRYWTSAPFFIFVLAFYANYSFLIPKLLFKKRIVIFTIANLLLFLIFHFLLTFWREHAIDAGILNIPLEYEPPYHIQLFKFFGSMIFVIGVAVSIRSTAMWFHSRDAMQKLELENVRSELSFLKMQISPHFLFNTLNNILALIDENKELAKESVQQLSKLLRSVIYDAEADSVTIKQEAEFLINYSNLMRLRHGPELKFNLETDLSEPEAPIAPLLLIPMLENIFKHGIGSLAEDSSIDIKISSKTGKIIFESENTYFPKTHQDKSGSGIGIANMQKRLDLLYEKRYLYDCKIAGGKYITKLELKYELN